MVSNLTSLIETIVSTILYPRKDTTLQKSIHHPIMPDKPRLLGSQGNRI